MLDRTRPLLCSFLWIGEMTFRYFGKVPGLGKLIVIAVVAVALFIGLGVLSYSIDIVSRIAVTAKEIASSTILLIGYLTTVGTLILGLGLLAYLAYFRQRRTAGRTDAPAPKTTRELVQDFINRNPSLGEGWEPLARAVLPVVSGGVLKIAVCGCRGVGKTALVRALQQFFPADAAASIDCKEVRLGADRGKNREILKGIDATSLVMLVVDQDLRDYEFSAVEDALAACRPLIVVINKADEKRPEELAETVAGIKAKLDRKVSEEDIICVSADPMPVRAAGAENAAVEVAPELERLTGRLKQILK
jgi:hypothetical protein